MRISDTFPAWGRGRENNVQRLPAWPIWKAITEFIRGGLPQTATTITKPHVQSVCYRGRRISEKSDQDPFSRIVNTFGLLCAERQLQVYFQVSLRMLQITVIAAYPSFTGNTEGAQISFDCTRAAAVLLVKIYHMAVAAVQSLDSIR